MREGAAVFLLSGGKGGAAFIGPETSPISIQVNHNNHPDRAKSIAWALPPLSGAARALTAHHMRV